MTDLDQLKTWLTDSSETIQMHRNISHEKHLPVHTLYFLFSMWEAAYQKNADILKLTDLRQTRNIDF